MYSQGKQVGVNPFVAKRMKIEQLKSNSKDSKHAHVSKNAAKRCQAIVERCIFTLVNESCRCLEEGIALRHEDVDIAMIFGFGFPPALGGLLKYADDYGLLNIITCLNMWTEKTRDTRFKPCKYLSELASLSKDKACFSPERLFYGSKIIKSRL